MTPLLLIGDSTTNRFGCAAPDRQRGAWDRQLGHLVNLGVVEKRHRPAPPPGNPTPVFYGRPGGGAGRCRLENRSSATSQTNARNAIMQGSQGGSVSGPPWRTREDTGEGKSGPVHED